MSVQYIKGIMVRVVAVGFSIFHIYTAIFGILPAFVQRSVHLGFALVLGFLCFPSRKEGFKISDLILALAAMVPLIHVIVNHEYFVNRFVYVDPLSFYDILFGVLLILLLLEATRRVVGSALPLTALVFLAYAFVGPYMPGFFRHRGYDLQMIIDYQYMSLDGIFGIPLAVSASIIVLFIVFGSLMQKSGMGDFFIDLANALTGRQRGGPAKVAIIASGIFGTISGSVVANVVTTGVVTIPLMKRVGYKPEFAAAVEAVASTGGQLMPPIMGAAAFVMAQLTGISYVKIITHAFLPAVLYYLAVFWGVHFEAIKRNLQPVPKEVRPNLIKVLAAKGHLLLPLVAVVVMLLRGATPGYAAIGGIASVLLCSFLKKETRMSIKDILDALADAGRTSVLVALACALAGSIIAIVTLTGLGLKVSSSMLALAGDSLLPVLFTSMIVGIFLGCGLPVTAAYVIQAAILVPALVKLGLTLISASLFVLYFAVISAITPPVAIGAYAAAGVAGSSTLKTALIACKLGMAAFLVPYMFVYSPELLMIGPIHMVILAAITAMFGIVLFASAISNWLLRATTLFECTMLYVASFSLVKPGIITDSIGIALFLLVLALQKYRHTFFMLHWGRYEVKIF